MMAMMKIAFYLQRSFSKVGDALCASLKEKHGDMEFCALVSPRTSYEYLRNEGLSKYTSLLLDEEVHERHRDTVLDMDYLKSLEKRVGLPNLWPYLVSDRIITQSQLIREYPYSEPLASHEDLLRMVQVTARALEDFLDREKPDAVIFSVVSHLGSMLLYYLARERGIPTLVIYPNYLEHGWAISTAHHSHVSLKRELGDAFATPASREAHEKAKNILASFKKKPRSFIDDDDLFAPDIQPHDRAQQLEFLHPARMMRSIRALWREWLRYRRAPNDYSTIKPWFFLWDRIKRKLRNLRGLSDLYDGARDEPYVFLALQYEPELSLLVQAPFFSDQAYVVEQVARSLPVGWKLYVKEHPHMVAYRPRSFYKRIKRMQNVRLIHPKTRGVDLIAQSRIAITITGTVAFEACLMGKPVITFGDHLVNDLSFVRHVERITDLPHAVKELSENFTYSEDELVHLLAKLNDASVTLDMYKLWYQPHTANEIKERIAPLTELISRTLKLSK